MKKVTAVLFIMLLSFSLLVFSAAARTKEIEIKLDCDDTDTGGCGGGDGGQAVPQCARYLSLDAQSEYEQIRVSVSGYSAYMFNELSIERKPEGGGFTEIERVVDPSSEGHEFIDSTAEGGVTYTYRAKFFCWQQGGSFIESDYTSEENAFTYYCGDVVCGAEENEYNCSCDCHYCGDWVCNADEDSVNCPQDCFTSGDGVCNFNETVESAPNDCAYCGDGECRGSEDSVNCPMDCVVTLVPNGQELFYGNSRSPFALRENGNNFYFHYDRLGSAVAASNDEGERQWEKSYSAFGEKLSENWASGFNQARNPVGFTGNPADGIAFLNFRAREYYPELGIFLQSDRVVDPYASSHSYSWNSPKNFVDPFGEDFYAAGTNDDGQTEVYFTITYQPHPRDDPILYHYGSSAIWYKSRYTNEGQIIYSGSSGIDAATAAARDRQLFYENFGSQPDATITSMLLPYIKPQFPGLSERTNASGIPVFRSFSPSHMLNLKSLEEVEAEKHAWNKKHFPEIYLPKSAPELFAAYGPASNYQERLLYEGCSLSPIGGPPKLGRIALAFTRVGARMGPIFKRVSLWMTTHQIPAIP